MEKFGIFELLDALSALTETDAGRRAATSSEKPAADPTPQEEANREKKVPDAAFSAPTYGAPAAELPAGEGQALGGFLARHEEISRKARK